jgi:hypothetical protein
MSWRLSSAAMGSCCKRRLGAAVATLKRLGTAVATFDGRHRERSMPRGLGVSGPAPGPGLELTRTRPSQPVQPAGAFWNFWSIGPRRGTRFFSPKGSCFGAALGGWRHVFQGPARLRAPILRSFAPLPTPTGRRLAEGDRSRWGAGCRGRGAGKELRAHFFFGARSARVADGRWLAADSNCQTASAMLRER